MGWSIGRIGAAAATFGGSEVVRGVVGAFNKPSEQNQYSHTEAAPLDKFSQYAGQSQENHYRSLEELLGMGPGAQDVQYGLDTARQYTQNPFASASDITQGQSYAQSVFAPQRMSLQQNFQDQQTEFNRENARLGRRSNDPVFSAKLRNNFTNQMNLLGSQQTAFGAQEAQAGMSRRLDMSQQLSQQAVSNRTNLLGLGNQIFNQGRQYSLATGSTYGQNSSPAPGFLPTALQLASTGAGIYSSFQGGNNYSQALNRIQTK